MVQLTKLLNYDSVVIQSHNIPDVDTVACGYALYCYFKSNGVPVQMIYGGPREITKPNITEFIRLLKIPIKYVGNTVTHISELVPDAKKPLLVLADCQYGTGNVQWIESDKVCVIDHHVVEREQPPMNTIKPYLGSCATLVWKLFNNAGFDIKHNKSVSTALYYGLYTDTNSLSEIFHPIDRDMLESLQYDKNIIKWLKHNNLTKDELSIAGNALITIRHHEDVEASVFMTKPCDPNILGFINDLSMQVKGVSVCVGFNEISHGIKLSIRSATNEVMANELAAYMTKGLGSGGGNHEKAGGFMQVPNQMSAMEFVTERLLEYFKSYDKLVSGTDLLDPDAMQLYHRKHVPIGFIPLAEVFDIGTSVQIRTLKEDICFEVEKDSYLIIGLKGEVYPVSKEYFENNFHPMKGAFSYIEELKHDAFYHPTIKPSQAPKAVDLLDYARPCMPDGHTVVYARQLDKATKVFDKWHEGGYMTGHPGDYLLVTENAPKDIHIIGSKVFDLMYERQ